MRDQTRILLWWLGSLLAVRLLLLLPHREVTWLGQVSTAVQLLLFTLAIRLVPLSSGVQRGAMVNLAIFLGYVLVLLSSSLVGFSIAPGDPYAVAYVHLYVNKIGGAAVLLLPVAYFVSMFAAPGRGWAFHQLSAITAVIVVTAGLFGSWAYSPASLGEEPYYRDGRAINAALDHFGGIEGGATPEAVSRHLTETTWGDRDPAEAEARVASLLPTVVNEGLTPLYWKPVEARGTLVSLLCVLVIAGSLLRLYRRGLAHGAYIDKILIILGLFHAVEAFHALGSAVSPSMSNYLALRETGHVFTILVLLIGAAVLNFKIRFSVAGAGRFYERAIALHPATTTRFVDEIDTLVLKTFFARSSRRRMGTAVMNTEKGNDHET